MPVHYKLIRDMTSPRRGLWRNPQTRGASESGERSQRRLWKTLSPTCDSRTWKRFLGPNSHQPDGSENRKPRQFDLCSHVFPQEHLIFSAAIYSFDIFDLSRLIKVCSEVHSSLGGTSYNPLVWRPNTSLCPELMPVEPKVSKTFICYILTMSKI